MADGPLTLESVRHDTGLLLLLGLGTTAGIAAMAIPSSPPCAEPGSASGRCSSCGIRP